ncbi:MAG: hypothetical protein RLW87_07160 [Alphaproteobacteria bacterium]
MVLPLAHVAPDVLSTLVADTAAALRANAAYLSLASQRQVRESPVDARDGRDGAAIEIFGVSETEVFPNAGPPESDVTEAQIAIIATVPAASGWETAIRALRARIRAVLLQDPAYAWRLEIRRIDHALAFEGGGALVAGTAALTVTVAYPTGYPPVDAPHLEGVDIDVAYPGPEDAGALLVRIDLPPPD